MSRKIRRKTRQRKTRQRKTRQRKTRQRKTKQRKTKRNKKSRKSGKQQVGGGKRHYCNFPNCRRYFYETGPNDKQEDRGWWEKGLIFSTKIGDSGGCFVKNVPGGRFFCSEHVKAAPGSSCVKFNEEPQVRKFSTLNPHAKSFEPRNSNLS